MNLFIYQNTTTNTTQTQQFNFLVIINFYLNYVLFQVVHDVSESKQCQPEENNYRSMQVLLENLTESSVQGFSSKPPKSSYNTTQEQKLERCWFLRQSAKTMSTPALDRRRR